MTRRSRPRTPARGAAGALALGGLVALGGAGCGQGDARREVLTVAVERRPVVERFRFRGRLRPKTRTAVKSPFDSTLLTRADHGRPVRAGEVVATVDPVPHQRSLEVLQAELETARSDLVLARLEVDERRTQLEGGLASARRAVERAKVSLRALVRGRDVVGILRQTLKLELDRKTLARLERELADQAPYVAKGFVSKAEVADLENRIESMRLGLEKGAADLALLKAGPTDDKVADRALNVAVAEAKVRRAQADLVSGMAKVEGQLGRAEKRVAELERQEAERLEKIAACSMVAPADGVFLASEVWMWGTQVQVGGRAWADVPVGHVAEGGTLIVVFPVGERHLDLVPVGTRLKVVPVADRRSSFDAVVDKVDRVAHFDDDDPVGVRWLEVTAALEVGPEQYGPLRPGASVEVERIRGEGEETLALPSGALAGGGVRLPDGSFRPVELGRVGLDWAEVVSGLLPGERVALPGAETRVVRRAEVTRGDLVESYEENGTLAAGSQEILYNNWGQDWRTKITWLIDEGSEVEAGTVCVKLDPGDLENEIESKREGVALAEAQREKSRAEAASALEAKDDALVVARSNVDFLEANLVLLRAGKSAEEKARLEADLAALRVDEASAAEKLKVTREMAGKGLAGAQEAAKAEETWLRARNAAKVKQLELELARMGSTESELTLAEMDLDDARAKVASLEAERAALARRQQLEGEREDANLRSKQQDLARKQLQLRRYDLAPARAGTVVYRRHRNDTGQEEPYKAGSFARRGAGIVTVADLSDSKVEGLVSEEIAWRVKVGQPARFWLPSFPEERYAAKVVALGHLPRQIPDSDGERGLEIELAVEQSSRRLQPGVRVRFEVELARLEGALLVPLGAVRERDGVAWVEDSRGQRREVEVLGRDRNHAALAGGVEVGEVVHVP